MRVPQPLDRGEPATARGWFAAGADEHVLVLTSSEQASAGIRCDLTSITDRSVRYECAGTVLPNDRLEVVDLAVSKSQARPAPLDLEGIRALGCTSTIGWDDWTELSSSWATHPVRQEIVSLWSLSERGSSGAVLHAGTVYVVRWMTPELFEWVHTVPPEGSVAIVPLISNNPEDLLP